MVSDKNPFRPMAPPRVPPAVKREAPPAPPRPPALTRKKSNLAFPSPSSQRHPTANDNSDPFEHEFDASDAVSHYNTTLAEPASTSAAPALSCSESGPPSMSPTIGSFPRGYSVLDRDGHRIDKLPPCLQDVLNTGNMAVCTYPGTSQYANGAPSACGIASMNAVRIVLSLERSGTKGCQLLNRLAEKGTMDDIMQITSHWTAANHLDVEDVQALPLFSSSLNSEETVLPRPAEFGELSDLFKQLLRLSNNTGASVAAVITKPPEIVAIFVIKTLIPRDSNMFVVFDSHSRPVRHPRGSAFLFFSSLTTAAGYLNELFRVDQSLLQDADGGVQQYLQLTSFDAHIFMAKEAPALPQSIYEANMLILYHQGRLNDMRNENSATLTRLQETHRETMRVHTEQHERLLMEQEQNRRAFTSQIQEMRRKHSLDLEALATNERELLVLKESEAAQAQATLKSINEQLRTSLHSYQVQLNQALDMNTQLQQRIMASENRGGDVRGGDVGITGYPRTMPGEFTSDRDSASWSLYDLGSRLLWGSSVGPSTRQQGQRPSDRNEDHGSLEEARRLHVQEERAGQDRRVAEQLGEREGLYRPFQSSQCSQIHGHQMIDIQTVQGYEYALSLQAEELRNEENRARETQMAAEEEAGRQRAQAAAAREEASRRRARMAAEEEASRQLARKYEEDDKRIEAERQQLLADQQKTFDCGICFDTFPDDDVAIVDTCEHKLCRDCLKAHIVSKLGDNRFPVLCPMCQLGTEDAGLISRDLAVQLGLSEEEYVKWIEFELAMHSVFVNCPGCQQAAYVDKEEYNVVQQLRCPLGCGHFWCKQCGQEVFRDVTHSCDGTAELDRTMAANGWKACPGCRTPIEKTVGCNHITCGVPGCNTHFCYVDGETIVRSVQRNEIQAALETHYGGCRLFDYQ